MLLLDITIVGVALPSIQRELRASLPDLQWVSAAYALVLAVLLLPAATLGDRLGRRRLFLVGMVVFTAGSLACALAATALQLELFRALQGVGGAVLFATATPLLRAEFLRRRPGPRAGRLRRHARRRQRHRAARGRGADRHPGLAVHLLRQPAHRRGRVRRRSGPAA
jgi:MFS family permease